MEELYKNVRQEVKDIAEFAWKVALAQSTPAAAAQFLDNTIAISEHRYTEEEIDFLRFYFQMKMEMTKQ